MKKPKIIPISINSKEAMVAAVNDIVRDKLRAAEVTAQMEQEIAELQKKYQLELTELGRSIQTKEAGVQLWAEKNRETEFKDKKSIDLTLAVIGFRETPFRVEKTRSKDTWESIAQTMAALILKDEDEETVLFCGENYVTYSEPTLSKKLLLQDRVQIPPEVLKAVGIRFDYDELFYIEPKSEVAQGTVKEAA